jgi:hypothetical protein
MARQGFAGVPPGPLSAYLGAEELNRQAGMGELQGAVQVQGMLAKQQQMQEIAQVKAVMAGPDPMEIKLQKLSALGPAGITVATHLAGLEKSKAEAAQAQRETAFYAPGNVQKYQTPAVAAQPAVTDVAQTNQNLDTFDPVAARPAQPAGMDINRLRRDAATISPKGLETYSSHLASEDAKRLTQQLLVQREKHDHEYKMRNAKTDAERAAETARHNRETEAISRLAATQKESGGLAGESAGKIAMADQAIIDLREARKLIFDDKGNLKSETILALNVPFTAGAPGHEDARKAYSKLYNAMEAKLRIETGAAATEREIKSILNRFLPSVGDIPTPAVVTDRIDRLEAFFNTTIDQTKGVRPALLKSRGTPPGTTKKVKRTGTLNAGTPNEKKVVEYEDGSIEYK